MNAGYLTIEEITEDEYIVRIPNKEVRKDFIRLTESYKSFNEITNKRKEADIKWIER